jgi:hypothetical protein
MNATDCMKLLRTLHACEDVRKWAEGKALAQVWAECHRGDWLLWLCGKMADKEGWPTREELVVAACACAERSLKYVRTGEERPRIAIETARRWAQGQAKISEVRAAADAAYSAAYADAADAAYAAYAAYAADAAAYADAAYADAAYAAYADAAYAAYAAAAYAAYADAAADAAYADAARLTSLKESAEIVRGILHFSQIEEKPAEMQIESRKEEKRP